jgi:hypothetical protein
VTNPFWRALLLATCSTLVGSCGDRAPRVAPAPAAAADDAGPTAAPLPARPTTMRSEHYTLSDFSATVAPVQAEATVPAPPKKGP